jgi:hypothetical protein
LPKTTMEKGASDLLTQFLTETEREELRNAQEKQKEGRKRMSEEAKQGYTLQELQTLGDTLREAGEEAARYPYEL